jgi:hypothetical protein
MSNYKSHDNRRHLRKKLACPVTVYTDSQCLAATTVCSDVSDGGVFAAMPARNAPLADSRVDLTFSVPRLSGRIDCFSVGARVVRSEQQQAGSISGVGLKFDKPLPLSLDG